MKHHTHRLISGDVLFSRGRPATPHRRPAPCTRPRRVRGGGPRGRNRFLLTAPSRPARPPPGPSPPPGGTAGAPSASRRPARTFSPPLSPGGTRTRLISARTPPDAVF